jgi:hypothetical protein
LPSFGHQQGTSKGQRLGFDWITFGSGLLTGGLGLKLIDYAILWNREKREQHSHKTSKEKDKPRFDFHVSIVPTQNLAVPEAVVKILSLGGLPLTINDGKVSIYEVHCPERVESQKLHNCEIGPTVPIERKFSLPNKLMNPSGIGEPIVKIVCEFSHSKDGTYRKEKTYNRATRNFE